MRRFSPRAAERLNLTQSTGEPQIKRGLSSRTKGLVPAENAARRH